MNNQELSIIIPVYNCQDYIKDCIDSILRQQDSEKHEIIIVNDGSTDYTGKTLDSFAKKHKNIRVINQKNSGVSVARNNGIKASHGKYITFVDADDMVGLNKEAFDKYLIQTDNFSFVSNLRTVRSYKFPVRFHDEHFTNDYFTNMIHAAHNTNADVVLGGKITINLGMSYLAQQVYTSNLVYGQDFIEKLCILNLANIRESANFALYRRDMLDKNNLRFVSNMNLDEDILFCMLAVLYATKVATVKDVTYFYNRHENTLSNMTDFKETQEKSKIAYIQFFSHLLTALDKKQEYSKLFTYWMKQYSKKGKDLYYPDDFPPDNCHYWCMKEECNDCNIAQKMRKQLITNLQKYNGK